MPVVSVTRLRVRSWRFLPGFLLLAMRSARQAQGSKGNLAVRVLNDRQRTFWTSTSWESDAAIKAFMLAEPHRTAMKKLLEWCDEAALVHWMQPESELPAWTEAHRRLVEEGRQSKVNHPSQAHRSYSIPLPAGAAKREVRLK
jgi:hypothetical protein